MIGFDKTVTHIKRNVVNDQVIYEKTIYDNCLWTEKKDRLVSGQEITYKNYVVCRIPGGDHLSNIKLSDYLVNAAVEEIINEENILDVLENYEYMKVLFVRSNETISDLKHLRAEGSSN